MILHSMDSTMYVESSRGKEKSDASAHCVWMMIIIVEVLRQSIMSVYVYQFDLSIQERGDFFISVSKWGIFLFPLNYFTINFSLFKY